VLSLLQIARLVAAWAADEALPRAFDGLPVALAAALEVDVRPFAARLAEASSTYVVGRGLAFATAREAALKLKEVGGLHAEACSGAEIMHGPKALLTPSWPVLAITGADVPHDVEATTLRTLAALTDALIVLGPRDPGCGHWIASPRAPDASLQPLVDATALFVVIEAVARTRGRDPDAPPHLRKVTETR
ncbi:MAG: SIS domain-containing protein, partial [Pseudomonadota bacterium]